MTLRGKKMMKKWKSDSTIQLGESCCSDILSDIKGFKKTVEERAGMEKKEHVILQAEGTPQEIQNKKEGTKKEESVKIQERKVKEHVIQVEPEPDAPQIQGVAAQSSFNHSGHMADSESGIMSNSVLIDPQDAAQMQGVAAQNSYNNYEPHEEWEPEMAILFYAVPIMLVVADVILFLHLFEVI